MIRLGVNVDHVATIRQARRAHEPDPVHAAVLALLGGADNITVHLREDRRHIQERDVRLLLGTVPLVNLEMACAKEIVDFACDVKPQQITLVPEKREELTTEGGLDVVTHKQTVANAVKALKDAGIFVSIFVDPVVEQIEACHDLGVTAIEIQTASFSEAKGKAAVDQQVELLQKASTFAKERNIHVHMGHGINYTNVARIIAIPEVEELNIGHSIVSRAVLVGMERAVREMKQAMQR